jgi:hypothetical protein
VKSDKEVDEMLGGRIDPAKVIIENIGTPVLIQDVVEGQKKQEQLEYNRFLRELANSQSGAHIRLTQNPDPLVDFRFRNVIGHDQYKHFFTRYPETDLVNGVEKLYSGHGSSQDHPRLHELFINSLGHHPSLMKLYTNA